jgi:uncharacterized protein (DUF2147 family)
MRFAIVAAIVFTTAFGGAPVVAAEPSAAGLWEQADDKGKVEAWFLIAERNGVYEGTLVKSFPEPGEDPNPICTKCEGADKGVPLLGLTIIKGMQREGRTYRNGRILDPRDGSLYRAQMEVSEDGQKLAVRGYLGIPAFGQTQTWRRLPMSALPQTPATGQGTPPSKGEATKPRAPNRAGRQ